MLCSICKDIVDRRSELVKLNVVGWAGSYFPTSPFVHKHHVTGVTFQASASIDCYVCATLWRKLSIDDQDILAETYEGPVTSLVIFDGIIYGKDNYIIWLAFPQMSLNGFHLSISILIFWLKNAKVRFASSSPS